MVDASALCNATWHVALNSQCPSSRWKNPAFVDALLQHSSPSESKPLVYVNAGANKGFAVAEFLQRFASGGGDAAAPSNAAWFKSIRAIKPSGMFSCGMCGACKDPLPPVAERRNTSVRVVALELLKGNHWLLTKLFERHRVPGIAINAAASNYTGVAYAPVGVRTGQEWSTAELGEQRPQEQPPPRPQGGGGGGATTTTSTSLGGSRARKLRASGKLTAVPSMTIDELAQRDAIETIGWLSIDAEGWDALILEGARALLSQRRVGLVEFEYHSKGMWAAALPAADRRDLKTALSWLHDAGYTCFWQGDGGDLAQASGAKWCDVFEWRGHSNLVCSHLPRVVDALRAWDCTTAAGRSCVASAPRGRPSKQHRAAYTGR